MTDRLGPLDTGFLDIETGHVALHLGGVAVLAGPVPTTEELTLRFAERLDRTPRLRQVLRRPPLGLTSARWEDDPGFDLSYHLRRTALPAPAGMQQLHTLVGRIMSTRLDDAHPLWEAWVVEGMADGRWAMLLKVHHAVVDGIAALAVVADFLDDPGPVVEVTPARPARAFSPVRAARSMLTTARGLGRYAAALRPFPRTSLAGELGAARRYRTATVRIADVDAVRHALGGTRNDVVLAMVTRAFREIMILRDEPPAPNAVRSLVPVSVRGARPGGNQLSALLIDLPVDRHEPIAAYRAVLARTSGGKASHESESGQAVLNVAGLLPSGLVSAAVRTAFRLPHRVLTTVVTNVPGPREEQSLLGRPVEELYPYVPLGDTIRIGVAVLSYTDRLFVGVTCDRDTVPDEDADAFVAAMSQALTCLLSARPRPGTARDAARPG